jgi:hypothetical protein
MAWIKDKSTGYSIIVYYYTSVYIFYIKLNADKSTILHIKIQLLILFK